MACSQARDSSSKTHIRSRPIRQSIYSISCKKPNDLVSVKPEMKYRIYTPDDFKATPWRNGQGSTTELLADYLLGSDVFRWRLSMAQVSTNGPFSDFSGYDRTLILMEGNGLCLNHDNGQIDELLSQYTNASFSGDWHTQARLIDGPIVDFNIMTKRDLCDSNTKIITDACAFSSASDEVIIYALETPVEFSFMQKRITLKAKHLLQISRGRMPSCSLAGGPAIMVSINYR